MVDVASVASHAAGRAFAYLITVTPHGRIHTSVVHPTAGDGVVTVPTPSDRVQRNAQANPDVSLVWPPAEPDGYSLIVDGPARLGETLTIAPTRAILHRPADDPGDPAGGCVQDCVEL